MPLLRDSDHLTRRGIVYLGFPCNLRCKHCYSFSTPDARKWRSVLWLLGRMVIVRFCRQSYLDITGGEPTMHKRIRFLVWFASLLEFDEVRLVTNGTRAEVVRPLISRYPRLRLAVSCHSHIHEEVADIGQSKRYPDLLFRFIDEFKDRINYLNICPTSINRDFINTPLAVHRMAPGAVVCLKMLDYNRPIAIKDQPDYAAVNAGARKLLEADPTARIDFRYFAFCKIDKDIRENPRVNMCSVRNNVYDDNDWTPVVSWVTTWNAPLNWLKFIFGTKQMRKQVSDFQAPFVAGLGCGYSADCVKCIYKDMECDGNTDGFYEMFGAGGERPVLV